MLLFRSELSASYRDGGFAIGAELIDSRAYLSDLDIGPSTSESNALELSQAWMEADIAPSARLRLGRFHMNLGSRRLISRNGYRNTVNSFTGARLDWKAQSGAATTLFWTMPHNRRPSDDDGLLANAVRFDRERDELQLFGSYLVGQPTPIGAVDLYGVGLLERDSPGYRTRNRQLATFGGRLWQKPADGKLDYSVEATWQSGSSRDSAEPNDTFDRTVAAGTVQLNLGYSPALGWKPRVALSFDYASGDRNGGKQGRYDTLYGSRSFEFGPTSEFGPLARANLLSGSLRFEAAPSDRLEAHVAARPLWLAVATDAFGTTGLQDRTGRSGRHVGVEYDARAQYWLIPERLRGGLWLAWLDRGRFLREVSGTEDEPADALYAAVEITASF